MSELEMKVIEDKTRLAYLGGYEGKYDLAGNLTWQARQPIAQRSRALRAATSQPAYRENQPVTEYILPDDLKKAGYRVVRGDVLVWWARGRGRNVIQGTPRDLAEFEEVIKEAANDLQTRGGPAKSRSKKARASTEEAPELEEVRTEAVEGGYDYQEPPNPAEAPL